MFSKLFSLFRKSDARPAPMKPPARPPVAQNSRPAAQPAAAAPKSSPVASASGMSIQHHAGLVAELESEHKALLAMYGEIGAAMGKNEWKIVSEMLIRLRSVLTDHLLKEGVKLYCYLQYVIPDDDHTAQLYRDFKTEMGGIGKAAFNFVERYSKPGALSEPTLQAAFRHEFEEIGRVLVDRIKREEAQLYPLYQAQGSIFM